MEIVKFEKDTFIARKNDKVQYWYLIQQGCVQLRCDFSVVQLEKNAIIGLLEKDIYLCDYIAVEDVTLAAFKCESSDDIKKMLSGQEKIRNIFLRASLSQRHQLLCLYSELYKKTRQFQQLIEALYHDYKMLCSEYRIVEQPFPKMESFKPLQMQHMAQMWEVNYSVSIIRNYLQEYLSLMEKDDSLTVGTIMEAAAQMRRFTQGIEEMEAYLTYNKNILIEESGLDLFKLFFDLAIEMHDKNYAVTPITEKINSIINSARQMQIYSERLLKQRQDEFLNYDYDGTMSDSDDASNAKQRVRKDIDIYTENCLSHILEYAGYKDTEITDISKKIIRYHNLPDMLSSDNETYALRKEITENYYEIYRRVFLHAVENEDSLTPILEMFLNFGFMDVSFISQEQADALYDLSAHLNICNSSRIYTIYEWLKCIYYGKKETSKNEFDQNFSAYLVDMYKNGNITKEQVTQYAQDNKLKVEFEIKNMFSSVNRLTYGKIVTFCPVLCDNDLINSVDKMLITVEKIQNALNEVRKVDYSLFYREVPFSDPDKGINNEQVMKEILPDIILMPNAGTKSMMWQETSDIKSDTPARFMFPIFSSVDLSDMMLEAIARYRWEICRKIEGIHWNDVREKSLTAEYCSFLQFYRKNNELSSEVKEKIKSTLQRAKNNYREVFVKDYITWIQYESKGSFRLNKISRDILTRHCPFVKSIRNELKSNPTYQASITRFEAESEKKQMRYRGVYNKYERAGGEKITDLKNTILFYEM